MLKALLERVIEDPGANERVVLLDLLATSVAELAGEIVPRETIR